MYIHELNMSSSSSESEQSSDSVRQGLHMDSGAENVLVVNLAVIHVKASPSLTHEANRILCWWSDNSVCKNVSFTVNSIFFCHTSFVGLISILFVMLHTLAFCSIAFSIFSTTESTLLAMRDTRNAC